MPRPRTDNTQAFILRLGPDLTKMLEAECRLRGMDRQNLIRFVLYEWLIKQIEQRKIAEMGEAIAEMEPEPEEPEEL